MKVVFFVRSCGYLPYFESALDALARNSHTVVIAYDKDAALHFGRTLTSRHATIVTCQAPERDDYWTYAGREIRRYWDYLLYLRPEYVAARVLRKRVEETIWPPLVALAKAAAGMGALASLTGVIRLLERCVPVDIRIRRFLEAEQPDVVLVAPLVDVGSIQVDYVRAARRLGMRTAVAIPSWDNLTNKGYMRIVPDRVFVWNERQQREAMELHEVPGEQVVITGAHTFDKWFDWKVSTSREAFCRSHTLDPGRPFVLFLGSTASIAESERQFVEQWIGAIRGSQVPEVAELGILVRPHPKRIDPWRRVDLTTFGNTAVDLCESPLEVDARQRFYDSIFHSVAVVGANTSAMIEAAIVGRPIYTVLAPEFNEGQRGTLHFAHLTETNGGLLHLSRSLDEHLTQLREALADGGDSERGRRFVEAFVRPRGIDQPASAAFAQSVEDMLRLTPRVVRSPVWAVPVRGVLFLTLVLPRQMATGVRAMPRRFSHARRGLHRIRKLISRALRIGFKRASFRTRKIATRVVRIGSKRGSVAAFRVQKAVRRTLRGTTDRLAKPVRRPPKRLKKRSPGKAVERAGIGE